MKKEKQNYKNREYKIISKLHLSGRVNENKTQRIKYLGQ